MDNRIKKDDLTSRLGASFEKYKRNKLEDEEKKKRLKEALSMLRKPTNQA